MIFSKISLLAAFATSVSAYTATERTFAVNYFYGTDPLVEGLLDPIISPGKRSGHIHTVAGGSNFDVTMDNQIALESNCTSSIAKADKTNYWFPKLFFEYPNGTFKAVDMMYMKAYYFFEPTTDKITAFEPGHRMVIGDPTLRTPPAAGGGSVLDKAQGTIQPIQWTCPRQNYNTPSYPADSDGLSGYGMQDPNNEGAGAGFPDQDCDGFASPLRADMHFPSCYNPKAGLDNYKENMDWPTDGHCPEGWEHKPHIFYEVYWDTAKFRGQWTPGQGKQPFILAQGDKTGYGLHADFLSGWDTAALQDIIDNCDTGNDGINKCPTLMGGVNDESESCTIEDPNGDNFKEKFLGLLDALPGNNPPTSYGAEPASGNTDSASPASPSGSSLSNPSPSSVQGVPSATSQATPYHKPQATKVNNVASSSTSAATSTPSTSNPTSGGPSPNAIDDYTYAGCFNDEESNRALTGITFANIGLGAVTNTLCVKHCSSKGFAVAGTEYGGQCFCGESLPTTGTSTECNVKCEGDEKETCGGSWALTVYAKGGGAKSKRSSRHLHRHAMKI